MKVPPLGDGPTELVLHATEYDPSPDADYHSWAILEEKAADDAEEEADGA